MTLNTIIRKLFVNNIKQYILFAGTIMFINIMIGGFGILQFSPTVTSVLMDGGSTQMIALSMFGFTLIGAFTFVIYAHSLFLKHKSMEIGIFISLGIKRENVRKIITKEMDIIFLIASLAGLLLSIPGAWLSWSVSALFIKTNETGFSIGWSGLVIAILFSILSMITVKVITSRYINKVDIINILKATEQVEDVKGDNFILGLIGALMIPAGILLYTSDSVNKYSGVSAYCLVLSLLGLYLLIVRITSIGVLLKRINPKYYYKNIVFFNMIKIKGKQYTLSLFVSTILIGVTIFGIAFNSAPLISSLLRSYNDPYDYMVKAGFQQGEFGERDINKIAKASNVQIMDLKKFDSILLAELLKKYNEWSPMNVVSEKTVYHLSGEILDVKPDSFVKVISADKGSDTSKFFSQPEGPITLLNPTTKEEFILDYKGIRFIDNILSWDNQFEGSFFVIDTNLFNKLYKVQKREYIFTTYAFNTGNWKEDGTFSRILFDSIAKASGGRWCPNYSAGPIFDRIRGQSPDSSTDYEYEDIKATSLVANRWWGFTPYSRYHMVNNSTSDFAVYLLLMTYISIIAFISSIMVIGIKVLNTMWRDKVVYKNITFLGARKKVIASIVSRQVALIYFVPVLLGTVITLFLFMSMINVTSIGYKNIVYLLACGLSLLVILIQIALFFVIRKQVLKQCMSFEDL